jgi:uncharacterized protein YdhG (YjbR/CyaY superfamily)
MAAKFESVDEYIASFPPEHQEFLEQLRAAIREAVPGAEERVSYGIAGLRVGGKYLVYFGGWKKHAAIYPVPRFEGELEDEVSPWRGAKDAMHLPYAKPLPSELVTRVVAAIAAQRAG